MSQTFRENFEAIAPQLIGEAWEGANRSDLVEEILVCIMDREGLTVAVPAYVVAGKRIRANRLDLVGADPAAVQPAMLDEMYQLARQLMQGVAPADRPTLVALRYNMAEEDLNADFHYTPLEPGVAAQDEKPLAVIAHNWLVHYEQTGSIDPPA